MRANPVFHMYYGFYAEPEFVGVFDSRAAIAKFLRTLRKNKPLAARHCYYEKCGPVYTLETAGEPAEKWID